MGRPIGSKRGPHALRRQAVYVCSGCGVRLRQAYCLECVVRSPFRRAPAVRAVGVAVGPAAGAAFAPGPEVLHKSRSQPRVEGASPRDWKARLRAMQAAKRAAGEVGPEFEFDPRRGRLG